MKHQRLIEWLASYPSSDRAFNQYRDRDAMLDRPHAAACRRQNLRCYLATFADARFVLVGEAAGYAGCRFSGMPFTCEAQYSGDGRLPWTVGKELARTSCRQNPWVEISAGVVWQALKNRDDCLLWNAFPWHPVGQKGPLSNRPPGRDLIAGAEGLRLLLDLVPFAEPYAVGRVAQQALARIGIEAPYIRHPSHGGKRQFLQALATLGAGTITRRDDERTRTGKKVTLVGPR
jgi:uracil-DNA glycosylase